MTRVVTYLFIRGRTPKLACSVGTMSWDVGGVRITRVVELVMPFPIDFSAEATPEDFAAEAWLMPDFVHAEAST